GKNFEMSREFAPRFTNRFSVFLTQESGSMEMRHSRLSIFPPWERPSWYHIRSLMKAPQKVSSQRTWKLILPSALRAPAESSRGADGNGIPACSAITQKKITEYPCWIRNRVSSVA